MAAMAAILKSIFCFFSKTEMPIDSKLGRKHRGDLKIKNSKIRVDRNSKMAAMAAILKIYFSLLLPNPKASSPNLVGSIGVTYRSKIAKIFLNGNRRCLPWRPS